MIKIAFTIGTLLTGGAEVFVVNLIRKLDKSKFDIILIVLDKKNNTFLEKVLEEAKIKVYYLNKPIDFSFRTMIKVRKILRKFKPNIIHGNIGGIIYVLLYLIFNFKVKAIHTAHTLASIEFGKFKRMVLKYFYLRKKIIPVIISQSNVNEFIQTYNISENYIKVIENGIDVDRFYNKRIFFNTKIKLGHVGRFEKVKNHELIFNVYKDLSVDNRVSLRLVGSGSLLEHYRNLLVNEDVYFIGETNNVEEELKQIDFFIFPSFYEGMPLSLIEAMASGCVIICSNVGGMRSLIEDGINGYKFEVNDLDSYVRKIKELHLDINKMKEISNNNIKKAKQYSIDKMIKKYEDLYIKEATRC